MIEVLKQAFEALKDVGVLTDREWQAVHKNKANELRQAIKELESQEPVAWKHDCAALLQNNVELWVDRCPHCGKPRTTHPPQRTWVGLTDDEIAQAIESINMLHGDYATEVAYAIESKLKDKNS